MKAGPGAQVWRLLPLATVVLAAHLWFLLEPPAALVRPDAAGGRSSFATRTIAPAPPAAEPAAGAATAANPAPAAAATAEPPPATLPPAARPPAESAASPTPTPTAPEPATRAAAEPAAPSTAPPAATPPATDPSAAPRVALPAPARYRYQVTASRFGVSLEGQAELHWNHDQEKYEARLEVSSPILPGRSERSVGRIGEGGLAPSYYAQKTRSEQAAHFERDKGRIIFSNNRPPAELMAGVQDRLSVVMQLAALIAGDPARFPAGTDIVVPTASTREAESWTFQVEAEELLQLPGGAVRALKLQRRPRKEFDQKVELWLAPRMDYAPVRLRLTSPNGDTVDQRWSSTDKG